MPPEENSPAKTKTKKRGANQSASEKTNKRPRLEKSANVPVPKIDTYRIDIVSSSNCRSTESRLRHTIRLAEKRAESFLKYAPKFQTDWKAGNLDLEDIKAWQAECDALDRLNEPAQAFSAQYIDSTGRPIFFYLADRLKQDEPANAVPLGWKNVKAYADRFKNSDAASKVLDGLSDDIITRYHQATQMLCSMLQPKLNEKDTHHPINANEDPRVMRYKMSGTGNEEVQERCGVLRLVHGCEKARSEEELYLLNVSEEDYGAIRHYFMATSTLAKVLGAMFKILFPEQHAKFKKAFEAGVWVKEDPGPWLGRAIVYKLQVALHLAEGDEGPAVSFPIGFFEGGEMLVPALNAKFLFKPGHVCFFLASKMHHAIARWRPKEMSEDDTLTPGRIGTTFFFPADSLAILEGKEKGWAEKTAMGSFRAPDPGYS